MPRADDAAQVDILRREINRLEPQKVYFPLGIGNHVDHQLLREVGIALLEEGRRWVMPGPDYTGIVTFYEDFPYAWWSDFGRLEDLPAGALDGLPADVSLWPGYADITDQVERKITGIGIYRSQLSNLFGDAEEDGRRRAGIRDEGRRARRPAGHGRAVLEFGPDLAFQVDRSAAERRSRIR